MTWYACTCSDDELDEEYVSTASSSRVASGSEPNPTPAVVEAVSDVTTPRVPRRPGVSHVGKVDSKKKKVKPIKVEKFSAPPFADATANAYEVCLFVNYVPLVVEAGV